MNCCTACCPRIHIVFDTVRNFSLLQKFHADEFGFDFDDKEAKEKQLAKMYDLLDDYLDPENEEGEDIMSLYNDLSAEMEKNSFLSKMLVKEVQTAKKKPIKK